MESITSRSNPLVAHMRRLAQGADESGRMLLDGLHLVEEARAARLTLSAVAFSSRVLGAADGRAGRLAASLAGLGVRVVQTPDHVIEAMSPAATPSGVVAIATRPRHDIAPLLPPQSPRPFLITIVDVQDPGNVGAIARVAEAAGATGLLVAGASADPFGWKALRGAMGSAFRLPIVVARDTGSVLDRLAAASVRLVAAAPGPADPFDRVDWTVPSAVLMGSEGAGLPPDLVERADQRVSIPMQSPVESLNVAVAAALIAYEARRQRLLGAAGTRGTTRA